MQGVFWRRRGFALQPSLEFRQDAFGGHEALPSPVLALRVDGFDEFIGQAEARGVRVDELAALVTVFFQAPLGAGAVFALFHIFVLKRG